MVITTTTTDKFQLPQLLLVLFWQPSTPPQITIIIALAIISVNYHHHLLA